eukprot:TRINITY_DN16935_c0_g1_i1.p3 TRINITY_DN16935_c0_g1~~TRINITY_DN16935_c0_g1_i1.p3  ORF type:complete len:194 (-),score=11.76 TRINITY_DN16935_c0_g1_i1:102-683(-)
MDIFTSTITVTKEYTEVPLAPMTTLFQNKIKTGDVLIAEIVLAQDYGLLLKKPVNLYLPDEQIAGYYPKYRIGTYGIILYGVCNNPKCIEYQKDMQIPLGGGKFNFEEMVTKTKCPACPYRELGVNPPIQVRDIKFVNCFWRYEGKYALQASGNPDSEIAKNWFRVEGEDNKKFYDLLEQKDWQELTLIVKIM